MACSQLKSYWFTSIVSHIEWWGTRVNGTFFTASLHKRIFEFQIHYFANVSLWFYILERILVVTLHIKVLKILLFFNGALSAHSQFVSVSISIDVLFTFTNDGFQQRRFRFAFSVLCGRNSIGRRRRFLELDSGWRVDPVGYCFGNAEWNLQLISIRFLRRRFFQFLPSIFCCVVAFQTFFFQMFM